MAPMALRNLPLAAFSLSLHLRGDQSALHFREWQKSHFADFTIGSMGKQRSDTICHSAKQSKLSTPLLFFSQSFLDSPFAGFLQPMPHLLPPCFLQTPNPTPCPVILSGISLTKNHMVGLLASGSRSRQGCPSTCLPFAPSTAFAASTHITLPPTSLLWSMLVPLLDSIPPSSHGILTLLLQGESWRGHTGSQDPQL